MTTSPFPTPSMCNPNSNVRSIIRVPDLGQEWVCAEALCKQRFIPKPEEKPKGMSVERAKELIMQFAELEPEEKKCGCIQHNGLTCKDHMLHAKEMVCDCMTVKDGEPLKTNPVHFCGRGLAQQPLRIFYTTREEDEFRKALFAFIETHVPMVMPGHREALDQLKSRFLQD